jgi:hypothetical protein
VTKSSRVTKIHLANVPEMPLQMDLLYIATTSQMLIQMPSIPLTLIRKLRQKLKSRKRMMCLIPETMQIYSNGFGSVMPS